MPAALGSGSVGERVEVLPLNRLGRDQSHEPGHRLEQSLPPGEKLVRRVRADPVSRAVGPLIPPVEPATI